MVEKEEVCIVPEKKVWNPRVLKWICIILSAFSGITLYIINFYRLDHPQKHKKALIGIGVTLVILVIAIFSPKYPLVSFLIFLIDISVAIYFNFEQKELFYEHIQNGGKKASSILAWIFGTLIILGILIIFGLITLAI